MSLPQRLPTPHQAALAVEKARGMIRRDYETLDDLPQELQDTIAHVYYNTAIAMQYEDGGIGARGLSGMRETIEDTTFNISTVKHLPEMIRALREDVISKGRRSDADFMFEVFILMFKYRIPNVEKSSLLVGRIKKLFYRKHAREVRPGFYAALMRE